MEELHKVAQAYYHNGSQHVQYLTQQCFQSMDTHMDGKIQFHEFNVLLSREGYLNQQMNNYLFCTLDVNRNGVLDFDEFLTLYYIIKTKTAFCCQCQRLLVGMYFTCVTCFDCPSSTTFNLCADCYNMSLTYNNMPSWRDNHPHRNFVDTALLLQAKRICPTPSSSRAVEEFMQPTNTAKQIQVHHHHQYQPDSRLDLLRALEIALAAGAVGVAAFCSIM